MNTLTENKKMMNKTKKDTTSIGIKIIMVTVVNWEKQNSIYYDKIVL